MEIDSSPLELDEADRRLRQLEIELAAMGKESKETREPVERELAEAKERRDGLAARWSKEKEALERVKQIMSRIDELKSEAERAERAGDLQRVAEIRYGELPELEHELAERDGAIPEGEPMVKEEVDEDDIAEVVARWTGIPVSRLLEGETEKLIHMEERLHERVGRPGRGGRGRRERAAPCAHRVAGSEPAVSARSSSSARPAWGRPSWRGRSPSSCSTTSARWSGSTCPSTRSGTPSPGSSAPRRATSATRRAAS
jgi:ATP-dependent Clp protease ATP-binding subunit ClpB